MINVKKALKICDKQKLREEYIKILPSDYSKEQLEANGDALLIFVENALKVRIKYNRKKNVVLNVPCVYIDSPFGARIGGFFFPPLRIRAVHPCDHKINFIIIRRHISTFLFPFK